jgi:glycosyl transferase family 25
MIKVYVINLARATERWEHICRQLKPLRDCVDIRRFDAVDGRNESHPLFERYDDSISKRWKGSSLSQGQLGCFASHYLVWQECLRVNEPVIVLEDDAVLMREQLRRFIDQIPALHTRFECLRLFRNHSKHHQAWPVETIGTAQVVKYTKGPMRGTGYYLTPVAAKKFLDASAIWFLPVDMTMDRFWQNKVECYGVMPPIISNEPTLESTIGYELRRQKKGLTVKFFRELFAIRELVGKHWCNTAFWISFFFRKRY